MQLCAADRGRRVGRRLANEMHVHVNPTILDLEEQVLARGLSRRERRQQVHGDVEEGVHRKCALDGRVEARERERTLVRLAEDRDVVRGVQRRLSGRGITADRQAQERRGWLEFVVRECGDMCFGRDRSGLGQRLLASRVENDIGGNA